MLGSRMLYISWRWPQLDPHISHAWCRNRDPLNPTTSFHKRPISSKRSLFLDSYMRVCKFQNGINFVQEKPLFFWFIRVSVNVNVNVNKELFLIWSGRHSVWNVWQVLKLERFLCNWTMSIIDGRYIHYPTQSFEQQRDDFYLSSTVVVLGPPQTSKPILLLLWKSCNIKTFINLIWGFKQLVQKRKKHVLVLFLVQINWLINWYIFKYPTSAARDTESKLWDVCSLGDPGQAGP